MWSRFLSPSAPPALHAVILSWDGKYDDAHAIARAVQPALGPRDRLSVIFSNQADAPETGPGDWVRVPQSWYFGAKFARSLVLARDAPLMLQIQADAICDDWPALIGRLRDAARVHPRLGIWAPDLDWTPYPAAVAVEARAGDGPLCHVTQTDGVVWALSRRLMDRLAALDYGANNLGWGIDYVAATLARRTGLSVLRDTGLVVDHPQTRGYSDTGAADQMAAFLDQLPPRVARDARDRQALTEFRRDAHGRARAARRIAPFARPLPSDGPVSSLIRRIVVLRGRVFVEGAAGLDAADGPVVALGRRRRRLVARAGPPDPDDAPLPLPLAGAETADHGLQVNGLGDWQRPGVETARLVLYRAGPAVSVPLGPPVTLPGGTGDLQFRVALAAHRARAVLRLSLDGPDGADTVTIPFWGDHPGGTDPDRYQRETRRIRGSAHPRTAQLFLDLPARDEGMAEPPVLFVAAPQLASEAVQPDMVHPHHLGGDGPGGSWYAVEGLDGPIAAKQSLILHQDDQSVPLLPPAPDLRVTRDGGTLTLSSSAPASLLLWWRDAALDRLEIGPEARGVTLPRAAWPVALRDASGSRVLWSRRF